MFDSKSRYYTLETATFKKERKSLAYKRRRFLPKAEDLQLLMETKVEQSDRLDLIAQRTIGDPEQFWRICDANEAMNPEELTAMPGKWLKAPVPQPEEPR